MSEYKLKEIKVEVTHKCPLACLHCSSDANMSNNKEMTLGECTKIILDAEKLGVKKISFSGGEPLIWRDIDDAISLASKSFNVVIYTSGYIRNPRQKFHILFKRGLSKAIFSIYGANKSSHEEITRIRGSFNRTIDSIKYANESGIKTEIHFVPTSFNYRNLPAVTKLGKKLGVERISILRFVPQGRGYAMRNEVLDKVQNIELKTTIENLREEGYNTRTGSPFNFLLINENPICDSGINGLIIDPDLRIYPCDAFKQVKAEEIVGTLSKSSIKDISLIECWKYSPYLQAIREYLSSDYGEICSSCTNIDKCGSGCIAQKFIFYGELDKRPDPDCLVQ